VNIHVRLPDEATNLMAAAIRRAAPKLEELGLATFRPDAAADVDWIMTPDEPGNGPTIVFDKSASAGLASVSLRKLLMPARPMLLVRRSCVKGELNNLPTVEHGRLFLQYLTQAPLQHTPRQLSAASLARLRPSPVSSIHYLRHDPLFAQAGQEEHPWADRDIDLMFVGTVEYAKDNMVSRLVQQHREKAIADIRALSNKYVVVAEEGRPFRKEQMQQMTFRTKIVVSPWGLGESCYRDFEALVSGCRVFKPFTPYAIETICETYSKPHDALTYVPPMAMLGVPELDNLLQREPDPELAHHLQHLRDPAVVAQMLFDLSKKVIGG